MGSRRPWRCSYVVVAETRAERVVHHLGAMLTVIRIDKNVEELVAGVVADEQYVCSPKSRKLGKRAPGTWQWYSISGTCELWSHE